MSEPDLSFIEQAVSEHGQGPDAVIPLLQAIQDRYQYLPQEALQRVCELTDITPASITGVSTFYNQFRHSPVGEHRIRICVGTACHVKGTELVYDAVNHHLGLSPGEDTDTDGLFTVEPVACLGCCTLAPVVQIDDSTYGRLTPKGVPRMLKAFLNKQKSGPRRRTTSASSKDGFAGEIRIGLGSCCVAQGSGQVYEAINEVLDATGAGATVKQVGCVGMCHQTPLMEMVDGNGSTALYSHVQPDQVRDLVLRHFKPNGLMRRMRYSMSRLLDRLYSDETGSWSQSERLHPRESPVCDFIGPQKRVATEYCGNLDPLDLDEYLRHSGFTALQRALEELTPEQIVDEIRASGLRGRGGAGFPTHIKWNMVRNAADGTKYIICNGDEGDPGAFMDRMLLESFPYRVIEGMTIAALAAGAHKGYFYIRAEYPLAVQRIREALARCRARGYLGDSVMDSGFGFDLKIKEGAGAFICGEETALIHSVEGGRGTPKLRPPYPAESGLWGRPTLINNVETLAKVPWIIRQGGESFAKLGTPKSTGTKVFALAGKVRRGGLIEVPMGVTLREIVDDIGGGVLAGHRFKAVQVGGPSGGCVPAELFETPVDYEALKEVGAIMGSGGLVVLDDSDCMVDIARYFLRFTQDQSCGKCTFCRVGTKRMLEILDRLCTDRAHDGDLDSLEQLSKMVSSGSLCGLGKTAPNPVLSTLKYFRDEYESHLEGRCPAGKCKDLIAYHVTDACIGCTLCSQHCPADAIPLTPYRRHEVDMEACTFCDTCRQVCPEDAVVVVPRNEDPRKPIAKPAPAEPGKVFAV
ncbi:MAG: NAD(P)H-dependent oxidoreductase subunit E [Pirellulaceae bacterium]